MKGLWLFVAVGQGFMADIWLEDVGVGWAACIGIAVAVAHSWYRLLEGR